MKKALRILPCLALLALGACSGTEDLGVGKTGKSFAVRGYSYDQVWNASLSAIKDARGTQALEVDRQAEITKQDKQTGVINANSGLGLWSWGEVMGVFINPPYDAPTYRIDVESLSKYQLGATANNWEDEIIAAIKKNLQSGEQK